MIKENDKVFVLVCRQLDDEIEFLALEPNFEEGRPRLDYYVVTGAVEPGEESVEAAVREVKEETDLDTIKVVDLEWQLKYKDIIDKQLYVEHCFAVLVKDGAVIVNEESHGSKWMKPAEFLEKLYWYGDERTVLENLVRKTQDLLTL